MCLSQKRFTMVVMKFEWGCKMATPDTRSGRNYMKTGPGMYAFAKEHKVAGWPWLLKPMGWLGRKHFKNIENSLADDETVVVAFLTKMAGLTDAGEPTGRFKWYAFALGDSGTLYFAHWRPFHLNSLRMTLANSNLARNPRFDVEVVCTTDSPYL